ncbi:MAG: DUF3892 domain-containing protein [Clostridia bacterium]|nr:DUF3892 domain-containing protein [Clostridia bacterium]
MDKSEFAKNTLDDIPHPLPDAKRIVGLVKRRGKVTGYKLSDDNVVSKEDAIVLAKQGKIKGVGIAHRKSTEYLKAVPNGSENDNLGNLPSITQ